MKKMNFLSVLLVLALMFSSVAFASGVDQFQPENPTDSTFTNIANRVLGFIQYAGFAIALGMIIFIGIKYMLAGAGQKAEVKSTFLPYLIGAVCVGAAATIANFFINMAN